MDDESVVLAEVRAMRAEVAAYRAETQAQRAEVGAYRAENQAILTRLSRSIDALEADMSAVMRHLFGEED